MEVVSTTYAGFTRPQLYWAEIFASGECLVRLGLAAVAFGFVSVIIASGCVSGGGARIRGGWATLSDHTGE